MKGLKKEFAEMTIGDRITHEGVWCWLEKVNGKRCWMVQQEGGGAQLSWSEERAWEKFRKMVGYVRSEKQFVQARMR